MAETIGQAREAVDAIGEEHRVGGTDSGFRMIAEVLGIDADELGKVALEHAAEFAELIAPGDPIVRGAWKTALEVGFVYGARWRGENPDG